MNDVFNDDYSKCKFMLTMCQDKFTHHTNYEHLVSHVRLLFFFSFFILSSVYFSD